MRKITTRDKNNKKVITGSSLERSVTSFYKNFSTDLSRMIKGDHFFLFSNRSTVCQPIDIIRWMSEINPRSLNELHIRNIILNSLIDSDAALGGSALVCGLSIASSLNIFESKDDIESDLKLLSTFSRRSSSEDISNFLLKINRDSNSYKIAHDSIRSCSSNAIVQISENKENTFISKTTGYKFPIQNSEVFCSSSGLSKIKINSPVVLVIDGFIESIAEIDGLVQESFSKKCPMIIFSRGFSDDVQNTLGVNYSHGHLRIIPITVPYDSVGSNLINDITVVCGADLVSSLKGELVSSRQWSDLIPIDSIEIDPTHKSCYIENKLTENSIKIHRRNLRKKRSESSSLQEIEIIDQRLSCVSGDGVCINLGEDLGDLRGIYRDRISTHIRAYKSSSKFGIIDVSKCISSMKTVFVRESLKKVLEASNFYTSISLILGIRNAYNCVSNIRKIGGIVLYEK